MGIPEKIKEIEDEIHKTQINKSYGIPYWNFKSKDCQTETGTRRQ